MESGKIVIASVLKPVDDTRLFEKLGLSLAETNKYDVNIIGFSSKKSFSHPKISFHPLFNFRRNSYKRSLASWNYYKLLLKLKPDVAVVSSPELLPVTFIYKILFGLKICYDVQENYYANVRFTPTYPGWIRNFLALSVRTFERLSRPFIDLYLLAEKCYITELPFTRNKSVVIQNKFRPLEPIEVAKPLSQLPKIRLLYTGTISRNYGIFEAIKFANNISSRYPEVSLKIIGYAPDPKVHENVKKLASEFDFIKYEGGTRPISHQEIINAVSKADFALLPYQPDKSIENCFPTKIWEYMAHRLPMIIQDHDPWTKYCKAYKACIAIDFKNYALDEVSNQMLSDEFYPNKEINDVFWHPEEITLVQAIKQL